MNSRGLRNRLWAIIVIAVAYLIYSALGDFVPKYWESIGFRPINRSILTLGMVIILLICLSGLALSEKMASLIIREALTGLFNQIYIRQRLEELGAGSLNDAELLGILIRVGLPGENAVQVGQRLLNSLGGLYGIHRADFADVCQEKALAEQKLPRLKRP
jgi:hypothetical protein